VGNFIYLFSQWLLSYCVVKLLGFEDAGILSLATAIAGSFIGISLYGMRNFQVSDIEGKYPDKTYIVSRFVTSGISLVVCMAFVAFNAYSLYISVCILVYMCFKISESVSDVYQGILQKAMRMDYIGRSFIAKGLVTLAAFVVAISLTQNLLIGIVVLGISSFAIVFFYDRRKARKFSPVEKDVAWRPSVTALLKECLPIAVFVLIFNMIAQVPRYFLEINMGVEALGIYATIAMPVVIVQVSASFVFAPLTTPFAQHLSDGNIEGFKALFKKVVLFIAGLSVVSLVGFGILGDWILVLLFGPVIEPYTYLLIPLVICTILVAASWFLSMILVVLRKLKSLLFTSIASFAVVAAGSMPCILSFGQNGASFILIIGLTVYALSNIIVVIYEVRSRAQGTKTPV